ncbi:hypothetical protein RHS01_04781 [Rhizoctonia solani]|uniref:Uncharacterized protein n=1 Tax=Rhizoctonia solani TaxID=456999 RepID=A0A8H7IF58_9AGAM|nr:hypothetical protein RHS01_04781 [Rhizoctonia solani]
MNTEAPEDDKPVWHDLPLNYPLPLSQTAFKNGPLSPWDTMIQRQEEEKRDLKLWAEAPKDTLANDACDEDGENSDVETILGDDDVDEHDWDMANDFDD